MKGYEVVPDLLQQAGLDTVFAMLGGSNVHWVAKGVQNRSLRLIRTRHEETAVNGAAGFARATGKIGLCSVTRGPGLTNAVNALTAATRAHTPILLVTGESPPSKKKTTPQVVDQKAVVTAVGAGFHLVRSIDEMEGVFGEALSAIRFNGCPQVLSIADGVEDAECDPIQLSNSVADDEASVGLAPEQRQIKAAVDLLMTAKAPLILAGIGVLRASCRGTLEQIAELTGAELATTLMMHQYFSGHPRNIGLCGGWASPVVKEHLRGVDLVLAVGASLNSFTMDERKILDQANIIQCEVDDRQTTTFANVGLRLAGDARATVKALLAECAKREPRIPPAKRSIPSKQDIRKSVFARDVGHDQNRGMHPRQVYAALEDKLPADRVICSDHGRFQSTLPTLVTTKDGSSCVMTINYGSIGLGLGTALGAAVAHKGRPTVLVAGDGGFMMSSHDLDAIRLNGVDVTIFIMNDEMYGSDKKYLDPYQLPYDVVTQSLPDIPILAKAFGGKGFVVRTEDELRSLNIDYRGLTLVDVRIDPLAKNHP